MKRCIHPLAILVLISSSLALFSCRSAENPTTNTIHLSQNWEVFSSEGESQSGKQISLPGYQPEKAVYTHIPATVMAALLRNEVYEDVFFSDNLDKIPVEQFQVPWWYRKTFTVDELPDSDYFVLRFEGINHKANVWLNGSQIGSADTLEGCFRRFPLEITDQLVVGENILAVEIIPPVKGDLTIGFVDWNPTAPDQNMGIWREVKLIRSGNVSIESPMVASHFPGSDLSQVELEVRGLLRNHSDKAENVELYIELEGIGKLKKSLRLEAKEVKDVIFTADEYQQLIVSDPVPWWPNNMGDPALYTLNARVWKGNKLLHSTKSRFGIREIEEYLTEEGHKGWKINKEPLIIKGGGWVDNLFLDDSDEKVRAQMDYVQHMNMNCVRLEGFWGKNKTLYDAADERGILLMVGWSCQWEWEAFCGRPNTPFMCITSDEDIENQSLSYLEQVYYMRNHPSVFLYVFGSDKLPVPALESKLRKYISAADKSRPFLISCGGVTSEVSGPSGVKMAGPYEYVPPVYWYKDEENGGAFGFNTETGPGPQVPPLESLKKMIPGEKLWPINEAWDYHCGRGNFSSLDNFLLAFNRRYGEPGSVEEFVDKAQVSNYEAIRPMFEAFQVNRFRSTGVIQWMLNSAWPEMYWQLYDYYLVPNGAFYGTRKGCQPLNPVYNYKDHSIYLVNDRRERRDGMKLAVRVFDVQSKEVFQQKLEVDIEAGQSKKILELTEFDDISNTYFLDLELRADDKVLADNFYWLSTKADVMDPEGVARLEWAFYTPQKEYADLQGINELQSVDVEDSWKQERVGDEILIHCTLENDSDHLAFFIEAIVRDKASGERIVPVFWSDNYVSLLPGELRTLTARLDADLTEGRELDFQIHGLNLKK